MLYMVIEKFRSGGAQPIYTRFREKGRMMPEGLKYVSSWITNDYRRCFQVMECDDRKDLDAWMDCWKDLMEFEVLPVVTSAEAVAQFAPQT